MSLYSQFGIDEEKEQEGIWLDYAPNKDKSVPGFLVRRTSKNNKAWTKAYEKAAKPFRRQAEMGLLDADISEKITKEAWVGTVLIGWRNIQDRQGSPIDFSREAALKLLDDLPQLWDDLWAQSTKRIDAAAKVAMPFGGYVFRTVEERIGSYAKAND